MSLNVKGQPIQDVRQAANQARQYVHGSYLHGEAVQFLMQAYQRAHQGRTPESDPQIPGHSYLDELWSWVNGILH